MASIVNVLTTLELNSYFEASQYKHWVDAMEKEFKALEDNGTWELTSLPPNKHAIRCHWVF